MLPEMWRNRTSLREPFVDDMFERFFRGWPSMLSGADTTWSPRVDISETEKEITIDMEIPGIDKKDVKVEVHDNVLTVSGERKREREEKDENHYRRERMYGRFERSFGLPDTVDGNKVAAKYHDGVLTLALAKTKKTVPKEIAVEVT